MSVSGSGRRFRRWHWTTPQGWGWEGPNHGGVTFTRRGAWRALRRAEKREAREAL